MTQPARDVRADLGLMVLALIWGVNFSVVKAVLDELDPLALNALRFPLAAGVLWLLVRTPSPSLVRREEWVRLAALGILGNVVYQLFFILGIDRTLAGNASLILATSPVWVVLLSAAAGHERPGRRIVAGCALTLVGMVLVVLGSGDALGLGGETLSGDVLMILAAVLWAVYTVGAAPLVRRHGSLRVTGWTLWIGTPFLVLIGGPSLAATPWRSVSLWVWAGVGYAGVLSVGIAYLLWYRGVQRLGTSRTAVYSNLVPVTALLTAWIWLGEVPSGPQLVGAVVILAGITLARSGGRRQTPGPSSFRWRTSGNS